MLKKRRKTQSQLQSGFHCCCSSGRHPVLSAVSPREVQRARDEDEAIVFVLPVRHSAPQFAFDGGGERKPQGSVGECSEGLWLGNLFGCKLKISPCGDDNQVPLVTISMCPAASSSMVGVFRWTRQVCSAAGKHLRERVGADGDRGLESVPIRCQQFGSFLAHSSQGLLW